MDFQVRRSPNFTIACQVSRRTLAFQGDFQVRRWLNDGLGSPFYNIAGANNGLGRPTYTNLAL